MKNFDLDLSDVEKIIYPDKNKIPFQENKDRFTRVAFDLFRLRGDDKEDLWQVQADDDGNEFLVRTYSLPEDEAQTKESDWSVISDKKCANLNIFYKDIPIQKVVTKDFSISSANDVEILRKSIIDKLANDKSFVINLLISLPLEKYNSLKSTGIIESLKDKDFPKIVADAHESWCKLHKLLEMEQDKPEIIKEYYLYLFKNSPKEFCEKHKELNNKVAKLEKEEKDALGIGKFIHEEKEKEKKIKEKELEKLNKILEGLESKESSADDIEFEDAIGNKSLEETYEDLKEMEKEEPEQYKQLEEVLKKIDINKESMFISKRAQTEWEEETKIEVLPETEMVKTYWRILRGLEEELSKDAELRKKIKKEYEEDTGKKANEIEFHKFLEKEVRKYVEENWNTLREKI
jgi:hypothetical protein